MQPGEMTTLLCNGGNGFCRGKKKSPEKLELLCGDRVRIQTWNPFIRSEVLYSIELRSQ